MCSCGVGFDRSLWAFATWTLVWSYEGILVGVSSEKLVKNPSSLLSCCSWIFPPPRNV